MVSKINIKSCNVKRPGQRERWKTIIGLISLKKKLCTCSTLFLYFSSPLFCTTTTWNVQKLTVYTFYGGNLHVVHVLVNFFSLPRVFSLMAASICHFLTVATNSCCSSSKKWLLIFLCESPSLFFSLSLIRWPVAYFLFFSVFLFLYIPNLSDDN